MKTFFIRLFASCSSHENTESQVALDFFKLFPTPHLQLEFFIHLPKGKGDVRKEVAEMVASSV